MNSVDVSEEVKIGTIITTPLSRVFKRMQSNNDGVKQGMTKWKVIGTIDKMQARNQSCLSKQATGC